MPIDHRDGDAFMLDTDTSVRTQLVASYINRNATAFHFWGKCCSKPGWVLVSAQQEEPAKARGWPYRKLLLGELKVGRVLNVAWHHTRAQTKTLVNENGALVKRVSRIHCMPAKP